MCGPAALDSHTEESQGGNRSESRNGLVERRSLAAAQKKDKVSPTAQGRHNSILADVMHKERLSLAGLAGYQAVANEQDVSCRPPQQCGQPGMIQSFESDGPETMPTAIVGLQEEEAEEEAEPDEPQMEGVPSSGSKQRHVVRIFPRGSMVEIYSASRQQWFIDGEVVEVAWESGIRDKVPVSAGSTKIVYGQGRYFKWVSSRRLHETVRLSSRPERPKSLTGHVMLEKTCFPLEWWSWSYFLIDKGVLQWWETEEVAHARTKPVGVVKLSGIQLDREGLCIKLRADGNSDTYCFKAQPDSAGQFVQALWAHSKFVEEEDKLFV